MENAWGLDATSFGNHEFDYGVTRIITQQAVANYPWLAVNIVEEATGLAPPFVDPSPVFTVNGVRVGVIGAELQSTPEIVAAGNTEGLLFLDEAKRIEEESERLREQGVQVQVVVIHQGTAVGQNPIGNAPGVPWEGPILPIADALARDDGRRDHRRPHPPGLEPHASATSSSSRASTPARATRSCS